MNNILFDTVEYTKIYKQVIYPELVLLSIVLNKIIKNNNN